MKLFKYMSWLLVAMTLSIGLTACSSDDDDDDVSGGKSELVGKWESEDDGYSWGYKLDSNGKGYGFESDYGEVYDRWSFTWKYKNNCLMMTFDDGTYEMLHVTYMDDDIMMFYWGDDEDDTGVFYKVRKFSWE